MTHRTPAPEQINMAAVVVTFCGTKVVKKTKGKGAANVTFYMSLLFFRVLYLFIYFFKLQCILHSPTIWTLTNLASCLVFSQELALQF